MSSGGLYATGRATLAEHHDLLNRHARKIELCAIQDQATNDRLVDLDEKVDKLDGKMTTQAIALTNVQLALAASDGSTKRLVAVLGLIAVIVSPLLAALTNYLTRPPPQPTYTPMTVEQRERWDRENPKR